MTKTRIGLIAQPFIDELLSRTDIVEFIDSYVPLKKRGSSHIACCPFHNEKSPSFNVVSKKQFYHCFGCGASGNAISFAMNYLHQSFSEAVETLATRIGMQVVREGHTQNNQNTLNLYQFLNNVTQFYQKCLKSYGQEAINYLKRRQVSGQIAQRYQIGYAPKGWQTLEEPFKKQKNELLATGMLIAKDDGKTYDRYRQRIMFPIHDRHGRIIGFGGRAIEDAQKPKYLNSPETVIFQKSRELYGLHQVLKYQTPLTSFIIVEGYLDVIALAQYDILNAVATLGTATSSYHIQLLSKYAKQLIFCFDGDAAGRQAAVRALENSLPHLNTGLDIRFIFLPEDQDPDSLVRKEGKIAFLKRIEEAIPLSQFFIALLTQTIDLSSIAGKSQLIHTAKNYLAKIPDGPYKQLLLEELARLSRIEPHRILQLIQDEHADKSIEIGQTISRTPVRIAIAILLQHPEIYILCKNQLSPNLLDDRRQRVLKTLMQQIDEQPTINTGQLIEFWRETPLFDALTTLAAWELQIPENALCSEFLEIIKFLAKQNRETTIQQLMKKAHEKGLTNTERLLLQDFLKQRHHVAEK